jgi:flagellar FliL protein
MAKAKNIDKADSGDGSLVGFLLALVILTLGGAGAGVFFGIQMGGVPIFSSTAAGIETVQKNDATADVGVDGEVAAEENDGTVGADGRGTRLVALDPIFANLAEPKNVWMRLEAALLIKVGTKERDVLVTQLSQDLMQFLRTVKLAQLEDASGLQFLRDDLNDVVRTRSGGQVTEILVKGLIVE